MRLAPKQQHVSFPLVLEMRGGTTGGRYGFTKAATYFYLAYWGLLMIRKKFSEDDYNFGIVAEKRVIRWLIDIGYEASKPDDVFAHDVTYAKGNEEPFSIEVERRYKWENGIFPFSTINIPERRWKKIKTSHFMVVCKDMSVSYLVYTSEVLQAFREDGFDVATNIYCRNERFIQVPRKRCLFLDLENTEPRSVDRMKHCYLWMDN